MVGKSKKRRTPKQRGSPIQEVPPQRRRESPRRSGSSVQEDSDDRFLPTSPQAGNEGDLGYFHVSPNDQSLDYQVNTDVTPGVLASREVLADNYENDNEDRASNTPPVNDPKDKLDSSTASNSKASKANSSGHPNDSCEVLAENSDDDNEDRA
jgi:hypothetical protein